MIHRLITENSIPTSVIRHSTSRKATIINLVKVFLMNNGRLYTSMEVFNIMQIEVTWQTFIRSVLRSLAGAMVM